MTHGCVYSWRQRGAFVSPPRASSFLRLAVKTGEGRGSGGERAQLTVRVLSGKRGCSIYDCRLQQLTIISFMTAVIIVLLLDYKTCPSHFLWRRGEGRERTMFRCLFIFPIGSTSVSADAVAFPAIPIVKQNTVEC